MTESGPSVFESERYLLREHVPSDAINCYELNQDPEVIKFTGDGPFASVEAARDFLENYDHYTKYKMGRWAVVSKKDGSYLGWCGLKTFDNGTVDLGYRFHRKYWGQGIATETGRESLRYGFEKLGLHQIVAHAAVDNHASIRVLEKLGLQKTGRGREGALEVWGFVLKRENFRD